MKKLALILLIVPGHLRTLPRKMKQLPASQQKVISKQDVEDYNKGKFQKEVQKFSSLATTFLNTLENFNKALEYFLQQPLDYQKKHTSFDKLTAPLQKIKQKPLNIALLKLLHYKLAAPPEDRAKAQELIEKISTALNECTQSLQKALDDHPAWASTFMDSLSGTPQQSSVAEFFTQTLVNKFPLMVKKVILGMENWKKVSV